MKRHINFWLVMFLAISLALPIYSMAADMKLNLITKNGDYITTTDPVVKGFFMGGDQNLFILIDGPFLFTSPDPIIDIGNLSSNCSASGDGSLLVTYSQGGQFSFGVSSLTEGAVLSYPYLPGGSFGAGIYTSWAMQSGDEGNYLAVFQADAGGKTSQRVVMFKIVPPGYSLTVNAQGCAGSSVTKNPDKQAYNLSPQETVTLTPVPGNGCSFSGWSGDPLTTTNPATILMNANKTITATFTQTPPTQYTLTVNSSGGTVTLNPSGGSYTANTYVTLTANPSSGYTFGSWSGVDTSNGTTAYVTMPSSNKTVTANFTPPPTTPSSGALGTKTNPIPMNKYNGGISFIASTGNQDGFTPIAANLKTWFVVDSAVMAAVTSRTVIRFGFSVQGFNNVDALYTKVVQDKAGNDLSAEVGLQNNTGDAWDQVTNNQPYNFLTTKFLYSIESPGKSFNPTVKVNFVLQ